MLSLVPAISPYLVAGDEYVVTNRDAQISGAPPMSFGNMPADGGHLILSPAERDELIRRWPDSERWIMPLIGAKEFLQGGSRYCLWLVGAGVDDLVTAGIKERVACVRKTRLTSARPQLADTPHLFAQRTVPADQPVLVVPRVSSEAREYVPMGYFEPGNVIGDSCLAIPDAPKWLFAVLTSQMHVDWLRLVGGRLKSDVRYSKDVVYNNFVLPTMTDADRDRLAELADAVVSARAANPTGKLANLYDPATMDDSHEARALPGRASKRVGGRRRCESARRVEAIRGMGRRPFAANDTAGDAPTPSRATACRRLSRVVGGRTSGA